MGNTHTALEDDHDPSDIRFQKNVSQQQHLQQQHLQQQQQQQQEQQLDVTGSNNSNNTSSNSNDEQKSLPTPRMTRNVTHTTNVTYDDTASLSTCATNGLLKAPSYDTMSLRNEEHHQHQTHKSSQHGKSAQSNTIFQRSAKEGRHEVGVMYSSPERCSHRKAMQPSPPSSQLPLKITDIDTATIPTPSIGVGPIATTAPSTITAEQQDQWRNAWEEDGESSDEEDGGNQSQQHHRSLSTIGTKISLLKPVSRRHKSDSMIGKKADLAITAEAKKNKKEEEEYEKPSIMMFFPLLRVLGKGSFGKVCMCIHCNQIVSKMESPLHH